MNKLTLSAMALSAFALAGCNDNTLTTGEAQEQMEAAFAEIDALPLYTQDRFQDISDENGACAVAYDDRGRGVRHELDYISLVSYLPQALQVACSDLESAFNRVSLDLSVENAERVLDLSSFDMQERINSFKREVASSVRDRAYSLEGVRTYGLE